MNIYESILNRRTIRKFKQDRIDRSILEMLINAARHAPSASNLQPLKYIIVDQPDAVDAVFDHVRWAAYIAPEGNPGPDEKPVAFIVVLADTEIRKGGYELDAGAAVQNIMLAAWEQGIGACWMGAIDRTKIKSILDISERYVLDTVVALGYAAENPVSEDENGSIKYYKDQGGTLHVPKRKLKDILL